MSKHFKNFTACALIILIFLLVNFLINAFDLFVMSDESMLHAGSQDFGRTFNLIFERLAIFQLAYFLAGLSVAYLFRWIGLGTMAGLVFIKYVMMPLIETEMTVSMFVWSRALSYLISTLCGGLVGMQIEKWRGERKKGSELLLSGSERR